MSDNQTFEQYQKSSEPGQAFKTESITIPVIEENIRIETRIVETGKVHVYKKVLTENYDADVPVFKEDIIVERKPINQYIDGPPPGIRLDGDITIIPVIKEVIVKRMLLVEELHITKRTTNQIATIHETLRREDVTIDRDELGEAYNQHI